MHAPGQDYNEDMGLSSKSLHLFQNGFETNGLSVCLSQFRYFD